MKTKIFGILLALVLVVGFSLVMALPAGAIGTDYYVRTDGSDSNDGTADDAAHAWLTIQHAIDNVTAGGTINVAAGTYIENIALVDGVSVYGSGDDVTTILGTGIGSVVIANGVGDTTVLSGFTIRNGSTGDSGGGMHNTDSSPTVSHCTFSANLAAFGGGMANDNSSPTVTGCTFSGNSADYGGGMHNSNGSSPVISTCTFENNTVTESGGGMFSNTSSPTVTDCTFSENHADWYGGGMENINWSSPTVTTCTFSGNSADEAIIPVTLT